MSAAIWIVLGILALIVLSSGKKKDTRSAKDPVRIDHPHVIDPDDSECSVCHGRFRKNTMICPHCGARFTGQVTDHEEFDDEEEELETWDEEDGF